MWVKDSWYESRKGYSWERDQSELLEWTDKFGGWITNDLAAHILWHRRDPDAASEAATSLIDRTVQERLLIARERADRRSMRVYVLSRRGALKVGGKSRVRWGEVSGGEWRPPDYFDHDLRTARLLVALCNEDGDEHEVFTGAECRRRYFTMDKDVKIPDGLFRPAGSRAAKGWMWLETEAQKKKGKRLRALGEALYLLGVGRTDRYARDQASRGEAIKLRGAALLLPPSDRLDSRRYHVNHRQDILKAIEGARNRLGWSTDPDRISLWVYVESDSDDWRWRKLRATVEFPAGGGVDQRMQDQGWYPRLNPYGKRGVSGGQRAQGGNLASSATANEQGGVVGIPDRSWERGELGIMEYQRNEARKQEKAVLSELSAAQRIAERARKKAERGDIRARRAEERENKAGLDAKRANERALKAEANLRSAETQVVELRKRLDEAEGQLARRKWLKWFLPR